MKKILIALTLLSIHAQAAITQNSECSDLNGNKVSYEVRPDFDENGALRINGPLYREMSIVIEGEQVSFTPGKVAANYLGKHVSLAATSDDSQVIAIDAKKLVRDDGDAQVYEGTMLLQIRMKNGLIKTLPVSTVRCTTYGEG